ncbi:hypothetical protein K435DRAFT_798206 [Dendrothele bispora CBS 962.96]|uniref:Uncharacterized protein n=1 Tax=Dendrothele bispora (strain CBS 962.96) TaxID=1314807 RepID=A0A4V4HFL0_DENBC|nr:hypothetical protein K435DRAFT_798206 [Dendrothele bispora CBS 962.96]
MSLDRTGSDGNNSGTAGLAPGESPQAPVSRDNDKCSNTAQNRPHSTVSSNREEPQGTSMPIPPGLSASASASAPDSAPASPSAHESSRQHNTTSSDHESANDQEQVNSTGGFTQAARQKRPKKHPLLGQRQAPFAGN